MQLTLINLASRILRSEEGGRKKEEGGERNENGSRNGNGNGKGKEKGGGNGDLISFKDTLERLNYWYSNFGVLKYPLIFNLLFTRIHFLGLDSDVSRFKWMITVYLPFPQKNRQIWMRRQPFQPPLVRDGQSVRDYHPMWHPYSSLPAHHQNSAIIGQHE